MLRATASRVDLERRERFGLVGEEAGHHLAADAATSDVKSIDTTSRNGVAAGQARLSPELRVDRRRPAGSVPQRLELDALVHTGAPGVDRGPASGTGAQSSLRGCLPPGVVVSPSWRECCGFLGAAVVVLTDRDEGGAVPRTPLAEP